MGAPSGSPGHGYASGRVVRRPLGMSGELGQADCVVAWFVRESAC